MPLKSLHTEGAELDVLEGAKNVIQNHKPNLTVECHSREEIIQLKAWLKKIKPPYTIKIRGNYLHALNLKNID